VIKISETFGVPAQPGTVWQIISNPQVVVGCVPGAALGEQRGDGSFEASVTVKFGPVRVTFNGLVSLELAPDSMTGTVIARGRDTQGGTRFTSPMQFEVTGAESGSTVSISGDVEISGKLAGVIEAGAPIVVRRMSGEFAQNLAKRCAEAQGDAK
jgi:uncharacterized protein